MTTFKAKNMNFRLPRGWSEMPSGAEKEYKIKSESGVAVFEKKGKGKLLVWCDSGYRGTKDVYDQVNNAAPLHYLVKGTLQLDTKNPGWDPVFEIYEAVHVSKGRKQAFSMYTGKKSAPLMQLYGCNYLLFARTTKEQYSTEIENDFIAILRTLTYEKSKKAASKSDKKPSPRKTKKISKETDKKMAEIVSKTFGSKRVQDNILRSVYATATLPPRKESKALWTLPRADFLGRIQLRNMQFLAPGKLLIDISDYLLIDTKSGETIWRLKAKNLLGIRSLVFTGRDMILLRVNNKSGTTLAAIDVKTGKTRWSTLYPVNQRVRFFTLPRAGVVLALKQDKRVSEIAALDLENGSLRWSKQLPAPTDDKAIRPIINLDSIWIPGNGLELVSGASGKVIWKQPQITFNFAGPPPILENNRIYAIDQQNNLLVLNAQTGKLLTTTVLEKAIRISNIYPSGKRIYLRGWIENGTAKPEFQLIALRSQSGEILWRHSDTEPAISNIIADNGILYFATPSSVLAVKEKDGRRIFKSKAAETGQSFPVRVRKYKDRVVYTGELIIAGFDSKTGRQIYSHGIDPLSQHTHLDGLDLYISRTQRMLEVLSKGVYFAGKKSTSYGASHLAQSATNAQNLSRHYNQMAVQYQSAARSGSGLAAESNYWKSLSARNSATINSAYASAFAQIDFFITMRQLSDQFANAMQAKDRLQLAQMEEVRKILYNAYAMTQPPDYAFRPERSGDTNGVTIIHLPTGKRRHIPLSPPFKNFGLANFIDFKSGIIYYQGLRILPKDKQLVGGSRDGKKLYGTYLIAQKIKLPR